MAGPLTDLLHPAATGRRAPAQVVDLPWSHWSISRGIGGRFPVEPLVDLKRNTHLNVMPKPGYRNAKQCERESHPDFVNARLQHPAVGSAINDLQQRGMGLIRTHGKEDFDRSVGLAVLSANIHRLGKVVRKKEAKRRAWHVARAKAI